MDCSSCEHFFIKFWASSKSDFENSLLFIFKFLIAFEVSNFDGDNISDKIDSILSNSNPNEDSSIDLELIFELFERSNILLCFIK